MSANDCRGCEYSGRNRNRTFIKKFTSGLKYICFCQWCLDNCRRCRGRPQTTRKRTKHIEYVKRRPQGSRHKMDETENDNSNDVKVYCCSNTSNSNPVKSTHTLFLPTNSKRQCGQISEDEPVVASNKSNNEKRIKQPVTKSKELSTKGTKLKRLCNISPYCTKQQTPLKRNSLPEKTKFKYNPLFSIFLCCVGMNEKKGPTSRDAKSRISPQSATFADIASCSKDFGSQYSTKSNQSLEIFSHALTSSNSQLSSMQSIFSLKWKRRFQTQPKKPSAVQIIFRNLSNIIRSKKSSRSRDVKINNVLVLGVPKHYTNKLSQPSDKVNRPLIIKDSARTVLEISVVYKPPNKICGPGEVSALLKLKESGKVRHVGVSNVNEEQIMRLSAVEKPACLQVEVHVLFQQKPLIAAANRLGIPVVAYSPLGSKGLVNMLSATTGRNYPDLLELPLVRDIAKEHSRTTAQILLRFLLQHGVGAIPKSTNPTRIKQNISVWDFELSEKEMENLSALDRGEEGRICDFGFFVGTEKHPEFPFKKN